MTTAVPVMSETLGQGRLVAQISADLNLSKDQVEEVYRAQLDRLREKARIRSYLAVLAANRTRSILRAAMRGSRGGGMSEGATTR